MITVSLSFDTLFPLRILQSSISLFSFESGLLIHRREPMAKRSTHRFFYLVLSFLFLTSSVSVKAQSNGKISGTVIEAGTGESFPGVSVYLAEQTYIGTTTGEGGKYFLLSVPPGTYTVVMSFVGFATLKHENVVVFSGRTTTVDGALREEIIQGEEIVVTAERPIVIRDRTSTVSFIDHEAIEKLPVLEVAELVRFQPGVVTSASGGFHFRGGRERETAYIIDGIPVQDVFNQGGGNTVDIEVQSVQELQVFTGTFDAELGGAQSGVVSITTRDPGQTLEGSFRALSGGYYSGNNDIFIGGTQFDPTDTKDFSLTLSGPLLKKWKNVGFFFSGRYEDRTGALKGERRFNAEDGFKIDTYRRWYRDLFQPDDTRLITLDSARTPTGTYIRDRAGNPITFATGDGELVDMQWRRSITINPKLVIRPTSRSRISYSALYNKWEGQGFVESSGRGDGRRYAPDFRDIDYVESLTHILSYKQTIGSDKVFVLRGSYKTLEDESYAFDSIDDPRIQYRGASDDVTGFSLGATDNRESRRTEKQLIISSDFTWQIKQHVRDRRPGP